MSLPHVMEAQKMIIYHMNTWSAFLHSVTIFHDTIHSAFNLHK